ncbi:hypothetical protein NZS01_001012 [Salmonella enterica]|nr:hypothetical protein [Salmonella enterica]
MSTGVGAVQYCPLYVCYHSGNPTDHSGFAGDGWDRGFTGHLAKDLANKTRQISAEVHLNPGREANGI